MVTETQRYTHIHTEKHTETERWRDTESDRQPLYKKDKNLRYSSHIRNIKMVTDNIYPALVSGRHCVQCFIG